MSWFGLIGRTEALERRMKDAEGEIVALKGQLAQLDKDAEEMEAALLERIRDLEKPSQMRSLSVKEGEKASEPFNGHETWSQRKARRILSSQSKGFSQKVLQNALRKKDSPAQQTSTP